MVGEIDQIQIPNFLQWEISRILKWRYVSTIFLAIFWGDIPLHCPKKIGLHFRILKFSNFLQWEIDRIHQWIGFHVFYFDMLQPHDLHGSPWENRWFLSSSDALGGEVQAMSATGLRIDDRLVFGASWRP